MTTYQTSIVAGVFRDNAQAQQAVEALRNAGFKYDQVGVAMRNAPNATANLHDDLMKLGVPDDTASFYEKEYQAGHIVVSVRPDGRDAEARDILRQHGAYDHSTAPNANLNPSMQTSSGMQNQPGMTTGSSDVNREAPIENDPRPGRQQEWHPGMGSQQRPDDQRPLV